MHGEGEDAAHEAIVELNQLLDIDFSGGELEEFVFLRLRCYYYPPGEQITMRAWLTRVRNRLKNRVR